MPEKTGCFREGLNFKSPMAFGVNVSPEQVGLSVIRNEDIKKKRTTK